MKWTLAQLRKTKCPFTFSFDIDLSEDLVGFEDILDTDLCHVEGVCNSTGYDDYLFDLHIVVPLKLQCAITLNPVSYQIDTQAQEFFTLDSTNEDANIIEGQTIDLREVIITNIILAKPMKVVQEGHEDDFKSASDTKEDEPKINPAFASLKNLLK